MNFEQARREMAGRAVLYETLRLKYSDQ